MVPTSCDGSRDKLWIPAGPATLLGREFQIVFADGREDLDDNRFFESFGAVRDVGGDIPAVARMYNRRLALNHKSQRSGEHTAGLLVRMLVRRHHAALFETHGGEHCALSVHVSLQLDAVE
jgi:hypothetical protein